MNYAPSGAPDYGQYLPEREYLLDLLHRAPPGAVGQQIAAWRSQGMQELQMEEIRRKRMVS